MAKLDKIAQKLFGSGAGFHQIIKFGSLFAGATAYTTDVAEMMSLSNWLTGWYGAAIGGNAPTIQDMNAVHTVLSYQLGYLMQAGVPEWDSETVYYIGSFTNSGGKLYISLTDDNTNNAVTDTSNWKLFLGEPTGSGKDFWGATLPAGYVWASGKTIGNAASNATERANADTFDLFSQFWTDFSATALPIYTSAGVLSVRGASAAADFAANKAISVPDKRGRVSAGKDNLGGTAANRLTTAGSGVDGVTLGAVGGEQTHALTTAELATHNHTLTDPGHFHANVNNAACAPGTSFNAMSNIASGIQSAVQTASKVTGITLADAGLGTAHNNVQPTIVCNYIIKL